MDCGKDTIIKEVQLGLWQLNAQISVNHNICSSTAAIVMLEVLAETLRDKAPMEFDDYFDVLREELPKGQHADGDRLNAHRHELSDILILNTAG